jgi:hypothetical protein
VQSEQDVIDGEMRVVLLLLDLGGLAHHAHEGLASTDLRRRWALGGLSTEDLAQSSLDLLGRRASLVGDATRKAILLGKQHYGEMYGCQLDV